MWTWANREKTIVRRVDDRGAEHQCTLGDRDVATWLGEGNEPAPYADVSPVGAAPPAPADDGLARLVFRQESAGVVFEQHHFARQHDRVAMHDHTFAHYTVLLRGKILVRLADNSTMVLSVPIKDSILFPAGQRHELIAIEPDTTSLHIHYSDAN